MASTTLTGSLPWNATVINGDVAAELARLKQETGGDIEVYSSATLELAGVRTLDSGAVSLTYSTRVAR